MVAPKHPVRTQDHVDSPIGWGDELALRYAGDRPLLDVSQGAPDYPPPGPVLDRLAELVRTPGAARYTERRGILALRQAFAESLNRDYGASVTADHVVITAGCNQAFCVVVSTLAAPGDEVILHRPFYFNHDMWLRIEGIAPVYVDTAPSYVPDPRLTARAVTDRTRAIVLVTPSNPTGSITPPEAIADLADVAADAGTYLVLDETYRAFRGVDTAPHDLMRQPGRLDNVVQLFSFSKEFSLAGYRVGAIVAPPDLATECLKTLDCIAICAPRISQEAALVSLQTSEAWRAEQARRVLARGALFRGIMAGRPGGFVLETSGAFYGWVRHPFGPGRTQDLLDLLVLEYGVLGLPGAAFTGVDDGHCRISYGNLSTEQIEDLGQRLAGFAAEPG